jgi:2-polyprenyl-3-methyl-5-hydroxy-6-metoxy-1,4-benzoquinol methylase
VDAPFRACDICGGDNPRHVLDSPSLDGPLVECRACGFKYVGRRQQSLTFETELSATTVGETVHRLHAANIGFRYLSLDEEHRLARLNAKWRLGLIRRLRPSGRLLEVGAARGDFLDEARAFFDAYGVEPNPELATHAARVAPTHQGLVETAPWSGFDVAASFHVIEHVDSPRRFVSAIADRLKPGALLVLETPDIDSGPFRLFKRHWRQFIPEHYYFFDPKTLSRLLADHGFSIDRIERIGKYASLNLIFNRLGRYAAPFNALEKAVSGSAIGRLTLRLNPFDIIIAFATKR